MSEERERTGRPWHRGWLAPTLGASLAGALYGFTIYHLMYGVTLATVGPIDTAALSRSLVLLVT